MTTLNNTQTISQQLDTNIRLTNMNKAQQLNTLNKAVDALLASAK